MIGVFFLASLNFVFLGIVGEYVGAIHTMVQKRPFAIEQERVNFEYGPGEPVREPERVNNLKWATMGNPSKSGLFAGLTKHIPPGQLARYLVVGAWNTLFGYGTYALFTALLAPVIPHSYVVALVLSSLLNITVSFLGYKWFVFKTKGNYLREWMRCVAVYSSGIALGVCLLPVVVYILRHGTRFQAAAPYLGGALLTGFGRSLQLLRTQKFFVSPAGMVPHALRSGNNCCSTISHRMCPVRI